MIGKELGFVNVTGFKGIHPQSMEIAIELCEGASPQVLAGLRELKDGGSSDTVICHLKTGETIPYMIIYDKNGVLVNIL